ncbi:unnamed protein product [Ectocarpus sp. 6 AP-2014]
MVSLKRALRLYLQQAPLEALVGELKASAAESRGEDETGLRSSTSSSSSSSWTSLGFQERVATELFDCPVAAEFPPRLEYVSRVTKVLLEAVETAGDEPAEGLLLARMACVSSLRGGGGHSDDTAFESFWFPRRAALCGTISTGSYYSAKGFQEEEGGAFFSFRVANRDNEVGLRVWEAGRALAEFCQAHSGLLRGKRVLELGAGIGMTGMAVAATCGAAEVVLTDYAPRHEDFIFFCTLSPTRPLRRMLANLHHNLEINRALLEAGAGRSNGDNDKPSTTPSGVSVRFLDWTDYCRHNASSVPPVGGGGGGGVRADATGGGTADGSRADEDDDGGGGCLGVGGGCSSTAAAAAVGSGEGGARHTGSGGGSGDGGGDSLGMPEVVLAADVVYDVKYHSALVGVVVETLRRCPDALIVFASTLRNSETMAAFHRCLEEAGIVWQSVGFPSSKEALASQSDNSPPFREKARGEYVSGGSSRYSTALRGSSRSDSTELLWCHPGDLERVKFCVCGRGRGLVEPV